MKILFEGNVEILTPLDFLRQTLKLIEKAGRTCYKSEKGPITDETSQKFVKMIMERGHFSVLEHSFLSVKFSNVSRGFTHELVRHRIVSFAQESTRYVDYTKGDDNPNLDQFQCQFVLPSHQDINKPVCLTNGKLMTPAEMLANIEDCYRALRKSGWPPEDARQILPNALTSDIVTSANLREWRHIFFMRTGKPAHWEIRSVMIKLLKKLQGIVPVIFDDFEYAGVDKNGLEYYQCKHKDV